MGMGSGLAQFQAQVGGLGREMQQPPTPCVPPPVRSPVRQALPGEDAPREPGDRGRQDPLSRMEDPEVFYGPSSGMWHAGEMSESDPYPRRYRKRGEKPREHMPLPAKRSAAHTPLTLILRIGVTNRNWFLKESKLGRGTYPPPFCPSEGGVRRAIPGGGFGLSQGCSCGVGRGVTRPTCPISVAFCKCNWRKA